jgi:hypothetical protein
VRYGSFTGVALTDESGGGNATGETTVDFREKVWDLSVKAVDGGGNSAVVAGDAIFYVDADTPKLSRRTPATSSDSPLRPSTPEHRHHQGQEGQPGFSTPADATLNGAKAAVVADANVVGGIPVLFRIDCADASANVDVVSTHKTASSTPGASTPGSQPMRPTTPGR